MPEPSGKLIVDLGAKASRKDLLALAPRGAGRRAKALWSQRKQLAEWLAGGAGRVEELLTDPVAALEQAVPDLDLPEHAPMRELARRIREELPDRLEHRGLEGQDFLLDECLHLLARVAGRVASRATTVAAVAQDPQGAVSDVSDHATKPEAAARVVEALVAVLGPPPRHGPSTLLAMLTEGGPGDAPRPA